MDMVQISGQMEQYKGQWKNDKKSGKESLISLMVTHMKVIGKMIYMMGMALINGLMEESLREILKMEIKMVKELNFQY